MPFLNSVSFTLSASIVPDDIGMSDYNITKEELSYAGLGFALAKIRDEAGNHRVTSCTITRVTTEGAQTILETGPQTRFEDIVTYIQENFYPNSDYLLDEIRTGNYPDLTQKIWRVRQNRDVHTYLNR